MSGTTTTAAAAATTAGAAQSAAATAAARLGGDMNTFLRMLTTQLQNQDPTQPLDPNQFTAQLSQFAAVEQQIAVNQHLDSLIALQRSTVTLGAAELLGRTVEVEASALSLTNGQSQMLRLPAGDSQNRSARITISNAAGTVVREAVAPLGTTAAEWSWDGRDNSGLALPNGSYRVGLTGLDASGVARGALTGSLTGVVTGIARQGETAMLQLGTLSVPVDALRSARP